ncbi:SH3 domain-containing protein [Butyrivibrio sp. AC2005]|uniref:SH3 domain-containing protein n=1 Tax=Butyrivibrio sp. AC2005 TaxID=1280672 RepID=UPI000404E212|nr:SH3 domain-containing protein [Butyrivibrio sp. AC2005]
MNFKGMNFNKKNTKPENPFAAQDKRNFWEFISDNKKLVMPIVLVVAVGLTIVIALSANNRTVPASTDNDQVTVDDNGSYVVPEVDLEKNAYEDVNELMRTYFNAYASGDMDTIKTIYTGLEATEELRLKEVSQYINDIPTVDVYTKPGPVDGSYVAYVYTEVLFGGYDTPLPGMQTMYVCTDENGKLYINGDVVDDKITEYISNISLQADVVDLNNTVAAKYNDIIAGNEGLAQFLSDMSASIQVSVGEALAAIESGDTVAAEAPAEGENAEATAEGAAENTEGQPAEATEGENTEQPAEQTEEPAQPTTKKIRATDVVNIRSSDSETADKIGKTEMGQEFVQLEALENGWSKIEYNDGTAYVKTEFFEEVTEDQANAGNETTEETTEETAENTTENTTEETAENTTENTTEETAENNTTEETTTEETANNGGVSIYDKGKMQVSEAVKLRKGQSTDTEAITTIYANDIIDVKEQYASGWAKVEYNGKTGYIKSEFLKKE